MTVGVLNCTSKILNQFAISIWTNTLSSNFMFTFTKMIEIIQTEKQVFLSPLRIRNDISCAFSMNLNFCNIYSSKLWDHYYYYHGNIIITIIILPIRVWIEYNYLYEKEKIILLWWWLLCVRVLTFCRRQ